MLSIYICIIEIYKFIIDPKSMATHNSGVLQSMETNNVIEKIQLRLDLNIMPSNIISGKIEKYLNE